MTEFSFDALSRYPDVEASDLVAADATDRLILDETSQALEALHGTVVVIGDRYGALTLGAAALHGVTGLRTHQDALSGERALAINARRFGLEDAVVPMGLEPGLVRGAVVVLLQLPRSLDALDEIAELVAAHADPRVEVYAGGRIKHMTTAMNDVLGRHLADVQARRARQKSRVLVASGRLGGDDEQPAGTAQTAPATPAAPSRWPAREHHADLDLTVCAHGAAFAGTRVDHGTRFVLSFVDQMAPGATSAVDLGCGTGVLAVGLARARPGLRVTATDDSAAAVASARATAAANGVADQVTVVRDDALSSMADASTDLVLLNPPFHVGATVHPGIAHKLFADAGRVLRPGGELWSVWNSHLHHRAALDRLVGPTRQVARDRRFTVTVSVRR